MKYKLIAADIDGTLLSPERKLTPFTVQAVQRCMEAGASFVLSSGRMPPALRSIAEELQVNAPAVCYNGGAVVNISTGETLFSTPLDLDLARAIALRCEERGLYLHAFIHGSYIAPRYDEALTRPYEQLCGVKATVVNGPVSEYLDEAPMKLLILDTPEGAAAALPPLKQEFGDRANLMHSQRHMIECVGKQTSKARALEFLRTHLNVAPEDTCAFGDGQNDLEMLLWAHRPYVMDNAPESLKTACDRFTVVPSNREDGVAQTIIHDLEESV